MRPTGVSLESRRGARRRRVEHLETSGAVCCRCKFSSVSALPPDAVPQDRISPVFFTNPNPDATIRCLDNCLQPGETAKYPPVTASEH
jgi:hypothetical protein